MARGKKPREAINSGMRPEAPCFVVAIGASAGGQAALEQLFTTVPADCGVSFVVVMHLPPEGPSYLAEILGRYTSMEVVTAEDGAPLLPDRVQVIPAGRHLTVRGGRMCVERPEGPAGHHHPFDRLLCSLAGEMAERTIAVVLSGFGTDGAQGVRAVREAGGIVIVQDPATAANAGMPESAIATGAVDFVLPPGEIPAKMAEIAHGTCQLPSRACRTTGMEEDLAAVFDIVRSRTGHDFGSYKANTVMRRIERRMVVNDVGGMKKYVALLRENPQEAHALSQDILIGVTSFFRDPDAFAILRKEIVPRLFADRDPDDPVRIWHACCATGEEVYSMAILVREYLTERRLNAKVQFFATDIDEVAIAQARAGFYGDDIEADVGAERLHAFFTRFEGRWQVAKQLREMIVFAHHSLIKDPPFSRLDLLVCRNFLIYLTPDLQKRLIALFHQVLRPGAFLFLGAAETVGRNPELFAPVDKKWKIFERLEGGRRPEMYFPFTAPVRRPPGMERPQRSAVARDPGPRETAESLLMERYAPPCVVVNEKYEVVHVSSGGSRFLEVPVGEPSRDILRMAREELRPALRAAIYKAFAEQKQVSFRGVKVCEGKAETTVNVVAEPLSGVPAAGKLAMVVFEPAPSRAPHLGSADGDATPAVDEATRDTLIRQLEEQLRITHEQLQATTEQLETSHEGFLSANEELMSINEEFQSANEELQSTNEELETSKEELQALNEELVTVNAELQGKVEELNLANSDMENLFTSSEIATLFLDPRLNIKRYTPAAAGIFNLIPADIGRPFRHLAGTIDWSGLPRDAEEVLTRLVPIEREVTTVEGGGHFLMRVLPYRTTDGKVDGVVVTLIDVTPLKLMEEQTRHLASFPQLNPNPVLEADFSGSVSFFNPATRRAVEGLGMGAESVRAFLPADLGAILKEWNRENDTTLYREVAIGESFFGETIYLTPRFETVRIYAYDITERKRMEEVLRRGKEEWERTFDSVPDLIAILDKEHRIVRVNRPMAARLGKGPEACIGLHCYASVHGLGQPPPFCPHTRTLADAREHQAEVHEERLGGDFLVTTAPLFDEQGNMTGIVHVARDITERKRAEDMVATRLRLSEMASRQGVEELTRACLDAAELFTGSSIGFFHFVNEDQKTLTLHAWSTTTAKVCRTDGKGMHYPIDEAGVWADCFHTRSPIVHNDYAGLANRKGLPGGHVPVTRELVVPVVRGDAVVAIAGVGNKDTDYVQADIDALQEFASLAAALAAAKRAEEEREASNEFLRMVNDCTTDRDLIGAAVGYFQKKSGCEAVGIRLRDGDDYPYYEVRGFPPEFVLAENLLCARDASGETVRDSTGNPVLECMCGNVIRGRFDPTKPFFTRKGSFWTNSTTQLLASTTEADRQTRTRNRCNGEGYESVALIPLCLGEERLGLLQLNDRRRAMFFPETIALWERLADYLAVALAKFRTDRALRESLRRSAEQGSLLDLSFDAICVRDAEDRITFWNNGAEETYGYTREEVVGRVTHDLFRTEFPEPLPAIMERLHRTGRWSGELKHTRRDGSTIIVNSRWALSRDEQGNPVKVLETNTDVTERKRSEELIRSHLEELRSRNEELTRFNKASVGRELRMIELKREVNALCREKGEAPPYPLDFGDT